nr:ribonuclease H-like domain-containing protein [Tanacetum cinerariifolium]
MAWDDTIITNTTSISPLPKSPFLALQNPHNGLFLSQKKYDIELLAHISYAVQQICLYMHNPREPHLAALKRILCYIRGTLDFGFHLYSSTTISLVGYTDTNWAGCLSTRLSTSAKTAWLRNLLRELHSPLSAATLVYCDKFSATYLSANPYVDIFTKGLPSASFEDFRSSLRVCLPPARTAGVAINEDERLARAINGLCDGLITTIEEKEKYILPPLQRRW